jgi:MIP family channel proteins
MTSEQVLVAGGLASVAICFGSLVALLIATSKVNSNMPSEGATPMTEWARKWLAEALGTFALVFVGVLSISGAKVGGAPDGIANLASIGFAHGLAIAVMIAAIGAVSGGHFNPAVTLGFLITGRLKPVGGVIYMTGQLVGSLGAAFTLTSLFGVDPVRAATPSLGTGITLEAAIVLEAVTTFLLVLVVFGTAVDDRAPKGIYPLAIGLTVALGVMAIGPITGGAMNPARAFGPSLAANHWANHAVYWIGPMVGGAAGAAVQHFLLMKKPEAEPMPLSRWDPLFDDVRRVA